MLSAFAVILRIAEDQYPRCQKRIASQMGLPSPKGLSVSHIFGWILRVPKSVI
jgi:hypothetical protein